jgi:uncharacterized protein (TIGR00255 family)
MIQSMTGFGKAVSQIQNKKITVEIKSLNSKNLDLNVRMSSQYRPIEMQVRKLIAHQLQRGKIDLSVSIDNTGDDSRSDINKEVVRGYMKQLKEIIAGDEMELLKMAVRMPESLNAQRSDIEEVELRGVVATIEEAIKQALIFRNQEGKALKNDFSERLNTLKSFLKEVKNLAPERIDSVKKRLHKSLEELKIEVDQNRFEQELIYYLEKFDITEEIIRLENHLNYFEETMKEDTTVKGKNWPLLVKKLEEKSILLVQNPTTFCCNNV